MAGNGNPERIAIGDSLMIIDAARQSFDMLEIRNRRFMYNPGTCTLIFGRQYSAKNVITGSHDADHGNSGTAEPFDSFLRGWIGVGKSYPHGVIHFAPAVNTKDADRFVDGYNTLQMFRENGAGADTVIRGFGDVWERPLSDCLPGFIQTNEKESEGLTMRINAMEGTYDPVSLLGRPALFTCLRVDRGTVPDGLFAYDIRHGDNGNAATVEKNVGVNHMGTVILSEQIDFGKKDYISLNDKNGGLNFNGEHDCVTVAAYMKYMESKRYDNLERAASAPERRPSATAKLEAAKRAVKPPAPKGPGKNKDLGKE